MENDIRYSSYVKSCKTLGLLELFILILFIVCVALLFFTPLLVIDGEIIKNNINDVDYISFSFFDEFKSVFHGERISYALGSLYGFEAVKFFIEIAYENAGVEKFASFAMYGIVIISIFILFIILLAIGISHILLYLEPEHRVKQYNDLKNNTLNKKKFSNRYYYIGSIAGGLMMLTLFVVVFIVANIFIKAPTPLEILQSKPKYYISGIKYTTKLSWLISFPIILTIFAQVVYIYRTRIFNKMYNEIMRDKY
ncbi:MAG: hypothetical protein J1G07_00480 [Clostridiales bacterium]|nr:hypothetical protein [Clostridiales bacterium]